LPHSTQTCSDCTKVGLDKVHGYLRLDEGRQSSPIAYNLAPKNGEPKLLPSVSISNVDTVSIIGGHYLSIPGTYLVVLVSRYTWPSVGRAHRLIDIQRSV
jgi:hypothetical protein